MKLTFFSNFMNHHQLPLCRELYKKLGDDFSFVAFEPVPKDRISLGYHDMNEEYDFVVRAYENAEETHKADTLAKECDILILGSAPEKYLIERAKLDKPSFLYSERIYKTGIKHMFSPSFIRELVRAYAPYRGKKVYLLCAGAYVARDFAFLGNFIGKTYKWGYFPQLKQYDVSSLINSKPKDKVHLLWAGRLIDWKHAEVAIEVAKRLKRLNYAFILDVIGEGECKSEIVSLVHKYGLEKYVNIHGAKHPEEVRTYMEKAHFFLFTSDRNEGWGAVLNEAMNSGCVVICNKAIGAVPFLIKDGVNGCVYRGKHAEKKICDLIVNLIDDVETRESMAINAYYTIANEWNAKVAAENFYELSSGIINGISVEYNDGPCSRC